MKKNYNIIILVTNEEEVRLTINGLKNKSDGSDEIHAYALKLVAPYIASILARIINNYRLIALISNLAKVFEKIIFCRLYKYAVKYQLISHT